MIRRETGFTLIELLITMVIFVLVIAAGSQIFTGLLTQFKQQSKIAETNIEGIVGLEILRQDIEHAGYGLPWTVNQAEYSQPWSGLTNYSEASSDPFGLNDASTRAPRAIISRDNATFSTPDDIFDGSDYLVIKAINMAINDASIRWTVIRDQDTVPYAVPHNPREWTPSSENLASTDRVILFSGVTENIERSLVTTTGGTFYTTYGNIKTDPWQPSGKNETRIVYGINTTTAEPPKRPFNRADYFIRRPATNMPLRCAPNTGILYKATMNHDAAGSYSPLPLLDCVADFQVIFGTNTAGYTNNLSTLTETNSNGIIDAQEIREQVTEVRAYILAHEGQRDVNYTFNNFTCGANCVIVGEFGLGRDFNFVTAGITNWQNYRWKVYTLVVKPNNLR